MLLRYGATANGEIEKKAHIYTQAEHGVEADRIDSDAVWVVRRLRQAGFHAYLVGGAVRDLLLSRTPNDFDIATDAHPQQIRRCFRSARIIGRRFRLVHVYTRGDRYMEVSTFRSRGALGTADHRDNPDQNNLFGTMEQDAERRDFTINALYYDPADQQIIDYVGGFTDIRQRRLRTLVPAETSFAEDPVRMIRAAKYSALVGFPIPLGMSLLIRRLRESLLGCSRERVTEEVYKILTSGGSVQVLDLLNRLRLFEVLFPSLSEQFRSDRLRFADSDLAERLRRLDAGVPSGAVLDRSHLFGFLFRDLLVRRTDLLHGEDPEFLLQEYLRGASAPLFPSKKDLAVGVELVLQEVLPSHRKREPAHPGRIGRPHHGEPPVRGPRPAGAKRRRRRGGGRRPDAREA
ncbi:MAG TPA: polynucleotide adenylyltransferase PcnB [Spirochaetia bacterium]|nr:polynucleotide adenylyltransferase PcnB [Spirochaetia bacterium]